MGVDKHDPKPIVNGPAVVRASKEMRFKSLHHHSTFSYRDGYGTPEDHVKRATELGMTALALTEHGNVSSHVRLEQAAEEHGVQPIFGCELYTGGIGEDATRRKNHLTVLAENASGYQNLLRVVSRGWREGFYNEPTVSGEMLADHKEGLVVLSGCSGSLLATSLVGGKNIDPSDASYKRGRRTAERMRSSLQDSLYLEVQAFPELEKTRNINRALGQLSEELGIPLVATLDAHYTRPEESELQKILHDSRPGSKKTEEDRAKAWSYDVKLTVPLSDKEIWRRLVATGLTKKQAEEAILNTAIIAERCRVKLPKMEMLRYPLPAGYDDPIRLFRSWCEEGWQYRRIDDRPDSKRYVERVKHEMRLIEDKGFVDYFLLVSDSVRFAKNNGIAVGPARGSAAASLVCYLLRITEVDPMKFPTLLFERFIDANRHDLPDIDLDFDDDRRHEVRDYLVAKYGEDRIGNIGTFVKYKGKNSLDDVQRSCYPDDWDVKHAVDSIKELLIERSSGDLRAAATIEDTIEMFPQVKEVFDRYPLLYKATALEGNVQNMSVHAAGLVVANNPLTHACAVYTRTNTKGEIAEVISLDKYDAEYLNVLKLDYLGLKTMGMVRIALEHIGMKLEDLYDLPLDDPETIRGFQEGDVVGVFQFDGRAMRSVNSGVVPDNFNEICDINALARPGPLHSGASAEYMDIKHGRKEATHYHPIVDRITKHTNYQVVYQEQILQIVRELGGFSWEESARIRKIISKKRGEQEFNQQRAKFIEGARKHGMAEEDADSVFSMLATAGAYAFNAAHCVSYGMLAYWTMWIKRHHPQAFYVASLAKFDEDDRKRMDLLRDARKHGVPIGKIHLNRSGQTWSLDGDLIRPGFEQVKGIGDKMAPLILSHRSQVGGFEDWDDLMDIKGIGPAKRDAVYDFWVDSDPFDLLLLQETIEDWRERLSVGIRISGDDQPWEDWLPQPTHRSAEVPYERTDGDVAVVWVGVVRERNLKDLFENYHSRTGKQLDPTSVKRPDLNEWVVMLCEDDSEPITITVDRWRYRAWKELVWSISPNEDMILVRGYKRGNQSRRAIYVTEMWRLNDYEEALSSGTR